MGAVSGLANLMNAPEAGIIFMICLFAGYPLSYVYRKYIRKEEAVTQQIFFVVTGFVLMYINCGTDLWHSVVSILIAYGLCNYCGHSINAVIAAFVIFMTHLLAGYYVNETDQYDINWTMPQCILTLRLIGLVWDVYDGHQKEENLSADQKTTALKEPPGLLEIFSFCWFYGGFIAGPQFPLVRFRKYISGELFSDSKKSLENTLDDSLQPCLERLVPGLIYLGLHIFLYPKFSNDYILSDEFKEVSYVWKWIYCICWYKLTLSKYQAAWLITEGGGILSGLAYNGTDPKTGEAKWDGLRNLKISIFELGVSFQSIIESFNVNTNEWSGKYVFKRLRFLGNKNLSHVLTLCFLAVWHGFHLGYFACFFMEFITVMGERAIISVIRRLPKLDAFLRGPAEIPTKIICKIIMTMGSAYGFLPFGLIKTYRWWPVYKELWFLGWIVFAFGWPIAFQILIRVIPKPKKSDTVKKEE